MKLIKNEFFLVFVYLFMMCFTYAHISLFKYDVWLTERLARYSEQELLFRNIDNIHNALAFKREACSLSWPLFWMTELSGKILTTDPPSVSVSFGENNDSKDQSTTD